MSRRQQGGRRGGHNEQDEQKRQVSRPSVFQRLGSAESLPVPPPQQSSGGLVKQRIEQRKQQPQHQRQQQQQQQQHRVEQQQQPRSRETSHQPSPRTSAQPSPRPSPSPHLKPQPQQHTPAPFLGRTLSSEGPLQYSGQRASDSRRAPSPRQRSRTPPGPRDMRVVEQQGWRHDVRPRFPPSSQQPQPSQQAQPRGRAPYYEQRPPYGSQPSRSPAPQYPSPRGSVQPVSRSSRPSTSSSYQQAPPQSYQPQQRYPVSSNSYSQPQPQSSTYRSRPSPRDRDADRLPAPWQRHTSKTGQVYYYNPATGKSAWDRPTYYPPASTSSSVTGKRTREDERDETHEERQARIRTNEEGDHADATTDKKDSVGELVTVDDRMISAEEQQASLAAKVMAELPDEYNKPDNSQHERNFTPLKVMPGLQFAMQLLEENSTDPAVLCPVSNEPVKRDEWLQSIADPVLQLDVDVCTRCAFSVAVSGYALALPLPAMDITEI